jgi:DNA-binding transcriptional ArsR family regulator
MSEDMTRLLAGIQHPLRREILKTIYDAGDEGCMPRAVAAELGLPLSNVSYHVRKLVENGLLTLLRTEPARGAIAHYYVCSPKVIDDPWVRRSLGIDGGGADAS